MIDLPVETIANVALIVTLAYTVYGLTGFGAAIVGVPLLAQLLPLRFTVPMMLVFDLCAGLLLGLRNRQLVNRHELLRLFPFVLVGMVVGVTALVQAPERWLLLLLGLFVVACGGWNLLAKAVPSHISSRWAVAAGVSGGAFTALYGSGGPIYVLYLARRLFDVTELRATIGVLILSTALARLVLFTGTGLYGQAGLLPLAFALLPAALLGYVIGSHLHSRLPTRRVAQVMWLLLILSGGRLVWRSLTGA